MFRRFKLDARKIDAKTKKASLLGDSLSDEEKENLGIKKEVADIVPPQLPEEDALTPVRSMPGAPKGLQGEVEEDYTPMTAKEIVEKRKEHEQSKPTLPVEGEGKKEVNEIPPTFRNVMQNLLKKETPEGKREQTQFSKYGPPEKIQEVVKDLDPYGQQLANVDVETAQNIINRSELPDILKDRAQMLFDSKTAGDFHRAEQLALNMLGATSRKQAQEATEWLRDTEAGNAYMLKAFDMYRIRKVMSMLSNTVLSMEGQAVIGQPKGQNSMTAEQRAEKARIADLVKLLDEHRINDAEFAEAKRKGMSAADIIKEWAVPANKNKESLAEKVEREYREEERRKREENKKGGAIRLNMRKNAEGDVTGPGGDSWEYEWTSGPTPTKDEPQKRKHRFPFHNKPSGYTPGEGDQGNLFDVGPQGGQSDMNYLANVIKSMPKTADNDMFSIHSFDNGEKWLTYTLFKRAYSKFRPGDIVVQYGKTAAEHQTYRRRFGSVVKAKRSLVDALSPILATVVSKPTPDDSLSDLQKGKSPGGGAYGPVTGPYDKQPEQGNRDGFDAKNTPRDKTKRKFIPYMDTADDEGNGFIGGRSVGGNNNNNNNNVDKKADFSAPVLETPEERAAVIEQPAVKPINRDPKRPLNPKKRYDLNEQNLSGNPNYQGEDSSGFDKERISLSMKKLQLDMKTAAVPTYEALQMELTKGRISPEEFDQMVEYYQLAPPIQTTPEVTIPENFTPQNVNEWDPNDDQAPQPQQGRGRLFFGKKKK